MVKMIAMPVKDAMEYGENATAMFALLAELSDMLKTESRLKKHHRPYLHVREQIDEKVKQTDYLLGKVAADMLALRCSILPLDDEADCESCGCFDCEGDCLMCEDSPCNRKDNKYAEKETPFADAEDDADTVTIPKERYDLMVEDLLTMAELIDMVSDMRSNDVRAIRELAKYIPGFAAYEKNRLSVYRDAAKDAEDIINRWGDELDEDDEPDEYFSD